MRGCASCTRADPQPSTEPAWRLATSSRPSASQWQRFDDWAILAAAALALAAYFPLFACVSLAARNQVTFDRAELRRIAEEHLQRLGMPGRTRQRRQRSARPVARSSAGIQVRDPDVAAVESPEQQQLTIVRRYGHDKDILTR
jgi:hypothetical protein